MEALTTYPTIRNVVLRSNNRTINLSRPSNIEAILGQIVSNILNLAYKYYSRSRPLGLWTSYVIIEGFFGSSYINYYYNNIAL